MQAPFNARPESRIAYIREIKVAALPAELQAQLDGYDHVWGIHSAEGACIALARGRQEAFAHALESELAPVSTH